MATRKTVKSQSAKGARKTSNVVVAESAGSWSHTSTNGAGTTAVNGTPTFAEIQLRAYEIFVSRGGTDGDDLADWFAAEKDLMAAAK